MTTDFRALCLELLQFGDQAGEIAANEGLWPDCDPGPDWLLDRAAAALAQPEPEGPSDQEIEEWADACFEAPLEELDPEIHGWRRCFTAQEFSETIRAALTRWGTPANNTGGTH
jgi:hypothetical protein